MAGESSERQERSFVDAVKRGVKTNKGNPITLAAGKVVIEGVVDAEKYTGRQVGGSEPLTDITLTVMKHGRKEKVNLSLKGPDSPSLAGGGMSGIETITPGVASRFMKAAKKHLTESMNLKTGDKVPDIYGKIDKDLKRKLVVGNKDVGGPVHYMYIGRMTVDFIYRPESNTLVLRGNLYESKQYADEHELYFRLRARREDQRFDPSAVDTKGVPKIYGKSPSKGDSAGRIVVIDKVPSNAKVIGI